MVNSGSQIRREFIENVWRNIRCLQKADERADSHERRDAGQIRCRKGGNLEKIYWLFQEIKRAFRRLRRLCQK